MLARELAAAGVVVVSGLARGIDGEAHRGALEAGGKTVAVLGCGIDRDYPRRHSELASRIEASGAIVSEYPPGTEPAPWRFPARNRIVAGLCLATVVVEARCSVWCADHRGLRARARTGGLRCPRGDHGWTVLRDERPPSSGRNSAPRRSGRSRDARLETDAQEPKSALRECRGSLEVACGRGLRSGRADPSVGPHECRGRSGARRARARGARLLRGRCLPGGDRRVGPQGDSSSPSLAKVSGLRTARSNTSSSMLRPVTTRTTAPSSSSTWSSAA